MKSSLTSRRPALAAVLVLTAAVVSGCAAGAASSTPAPAASASSTPTATSSRIPLATGRPASSKQASLEAILPPLITCMKALGMPLASSATDKQVRHAFVALPLASQERVFKACEHVLPASARQVIANDLAAEKGMAK
jgi:hypothetical protein